MKVVETNVQLTRRLVALGSVAILATAACAPQAAAPTAAPAKPAPTAAPAKPAATTAPAKPAPTTAPAKPAATAAPAAKPTEKPAAKPAFDEKAVADFYKGKTVRIIVGYGPGGTTDVDARLLQKVLGKYIPGNPAIVVENRPGAGSMLVANTVYNSEPKDGTAIGSWTQTLIVQQAIGAQGVQYDAGKYQFLASSFQGSEACAVRTDSGINSVQDVIGQSGKEVAMSSYGKGTNSYDPPATMNAALGTRFKVITGYESGAAQRLAVQNKEVQGYCTGFETTMASIAKSMFEGSNPMAKVIVVMGDKTPDHPFMKGVPAAETLAKTDEASAMLRVVFGPSQMNTPYTFAPEVPKDRVEAVRRAFDKAYADPEYLAGAKAANLDSKPKTGEAVTQIVQGILNSPRPVLDKLKQVIG